MCSRAETHVRHEETVDLGMRFGERNHWDVS